MARISGFNNCRLDLPHALLPKPVLVLVVLLWLPSCLPPVDQEVTAAKSVAQEFILLLKEENYEGAVALYTIQSATDRERVLQSLKNTELRYGIVQDYELLDASAKQSILDPTTVVLDYRVQYSRALTWHKFLTVDVSDPAIGKPQFRIVDHAILDSIAPTNQ